MGEREGGREGERERLRRDKGRMREGGGKKKGSEGRRKQY